jgi:hypothetical protein
MPTLVSSLNLCATFRRVCSWCRCDLGPLEHPTEQHSYGICERCQYQYFAHLYEPDTEEHAATEVLHERADQFLARWLLYRSAMEAHSRIEQIGA